MGLSELVARLERDADARVAAVDERSQRELEALEAEQARTSSRRHGDALAAKRAERRATLERELSAARQRERAAVLSARLALVDRVMVRTARLLEDAAHDEAYRSALAASLRVALQFIEGGVVRCRPELAALVEQALQGSEGVVIQEVPGMPVGIAIASRDGSMDIDETLPARLSRMREGLAIELFRELSDAR